jgi:hypothetical protein
LTISPERASYVVITAREFDAKDPATEMDPGSNPSDDKEVDVLEEHADDPAQEELTSFIDARADPSCGLASPGRDSADASEWPELRRKEGLVHNDRIASYLLGMPDGR